MSDPRDTQFVGFANRLWDAMPDVPEDHHEVAAYDKWSDECERIIACYAYDLARHTAQTLKHGWESIDVLMHYVKDPTERSEKNT